MRIPLIFFIVLLLRLPVPGQDVSKKSILVILAHVDDETAFGGSLASLAGQGHIVQLVYAVDGRNDARLLPHAPPDSIVAQKKAEAGCSCRELGIQSPVFLGFNSLDRKYGNKDGVADAVRSGARFRDTIRTIIENSKPDVLITLGPDGEYGHPEHIIVHSIVTELLLREAWVDKYPLYYFGWPRSLEEGNDGWVRYADDRYFNLVLEYSDADEQKAFASMRCYKSGFTQKDLDEMIQSETKRENIHYFRKFIVERGQRKSF